MSMSSTFTGRSYDSESYAESSQSSCVKLRGKLKFILLTDRTMKVIFLVSIHAGTGNKNVYRSFNLRWYKDFSWIHFCQTRNNVYC